MGGRSGSIANSIGVSGALLRHLKTKSIVQLRMSSRTGRIALLRWITFVLRLKC